MQLKKFYRKGCQLYAAQILEATDDETLRLEDYQVLQEFRDVFPDEIPGLPTSEFHLLMSPKYELHTTGNLSYRTSLTALLKPTY